VNGLPYYKAYPRDFIEGTIGMPFELKSAYRLVLDLIYMQGGNLPDDARYISGLLGCTIRKWNSLRDQLVAMDKIQVNGASLTNYRAVIELETLAKLQEKQRENASGPRKNKDLAEPQLRHSEPEPEPESEREEERHTPVAAAPGASARSSSKAKKQNRAPDYHGDFLMLWAEFPRHPNSSKSEAYAAWLRLPIDDREPCFDGARLFARRCDEERTEPRYITHLVTWINQRRFETILETAQ
jgi:uncharacterized protein YdaU (DUF1376 family)